jgi:hypothetical protein
LNLPGGVRTICRKKIHRLLVVRRKVLDSNCFIELHEIRRSAGETVVGDDDALVVAIQSIESFSNQLQFVMRSHIETACKSKISSGIVGAKKCVATVTGNAVIGIVAIPIGISSDASIDGTTATDGEDSGKLPVVEELGEDRVVAAKGLRLVDRGKYEALTLIGDAGSAFGSGGVGVLHGGWTAGNECILAIVDGVGEGVSHTEVEASAHAAVQREGHAVIGARGFAVEIVDRTELWERACDRIDAWRIRAGHGAGDLPGRERWHGVISAKEVGAGFVVDRIGERVADESSC